MKSPHVTSEERGLGLEALECAHESGVAVPRSGVEGIVGGQPARGLPAAFDSVELRGVRRQSVQFDALFVRREPRLALVVKVEAGAVVDDEKEFRRLANGGVVCGDERNKEGVERLAIEHVGELVVKTRSLGDFHSTVHMGRVALAVGVHHWLLADWRPGAVKRAVLPEADFVFEQDYPSALLGFFLISGRRSSAQARWASASARASRLRGRWMENRILARSRGMYSK